ncbi:hypothetical protein pdam_00020967, partial [Pocillopora damicornis]
TIKFADLCEFGWLTDNKYLSDELTSNSDDEKKIFQVERRAERKAQRAGSSRLRSSSYQSRASVPPSSSNSLVGYRPMCKDFGNFCGLGPCQDEDHIYFSFRLNLPPHLN